VNIEPGAFQPLPLNDQRATAARAEAEALLAQANKMHADAEDEAERITSSANTEATYTVERARQDAARIREQAQAEQAERQKKDDTFDTWSARLVIAGAVGLTASGEYELAKMAGFEPVVAWLLPFVIDVYVIQAFRRHRDIIQAIALTIGANVIYHLADEGLFGVNTSSRGEHQPTWWLIALVASVASLILWRMHLITAPSKPPRERQKRRQKAVPSNDNSERQDRPVPPTEPPTTVAAKSTTPVDKSERQERPPVADKKRQEAPANTATTSAKKTAASSRQKPAKKAPARRSMDEWVALTEPVFHAEFKRLKRNPTASEFAAAIAKAGHGKPSDSTAKNIRTEILDRAELPSLEDTE
jgi:hypothetical protein